MRFPGHDVEGYCVSVDHSLVQLPLSRCHPFSVTAMNECGVRRAERCSLHAAVGVGVVESGVEWMRGIQGAFSEDGCEHLHMLSDR